MELFYFVWELKVLAVREHYLAQKCQPSFQLDYKISLSGHNFSFKNIKIILWSFVIFPGHSYFSLRIRRMDHGYLLFCSNTSPQECAILNHGHTSIFFFFFFLTLPCVFVTILDFNHGHLLFFPHISPLISKNTKLISWPSFILLEHFFLSIRSLNHGLSSFCWNTYLLSKYSKLKSWPFFILLEHFFLSIRSLNHGLSSFCWNTSF